MKPMKWTGDNASDKAELQRRFAKIKANIVQYFRDGRHYNENHLPPGEPPIDLDPDGEIRRQLEWCDRALAGEFFAD